MKKNSLLGFALGAFFAVTNPATASEKYPASDFQPTVIYLDKSVAAAEATAEEAVDPKYPAANFQPKVIYSDSSLAGQTQAAKEPEKDEFDAKYPAAYFKPKVIYP